ncbi:uncharacterized protein TNCV_2552961 [Trichonephila clavipes]|nr:uncharacterized protein TNCV_2552961 [Trichonephila clavipes]
MPLCRFRRQYEQLSQLQRVIIIGMKEAWWSARRVARQLNRYDCVVMRCWDQLDPRDVIYTKTRLRTTSTDQSSRRPPHRKKCTRTANCFIGHLQAQVAPSIGVPVSSRTIRMRLAEGHSV